jgi:hypothetical protein
MNQSNKPAFPVSQPATGALPEIQIYRDAAGECVGQKPTHMSAITPSFDLTSPEACALSSADLALAAKLNTSVFQWRGKPSIFAKDKKFTWNAPKPIKATDVTSQQSINTEAVDREVRRMARAAL